MSELTPHEIFPEVKSEPSPRELDALIAERVTGWTDLVWHDPEHPSFDLHGNPPPKNSRVIQHVPDYSANMDFAMDVVKEMAKKGHTMHLEWKGEGRIYAHSIRVVFMKGSTPTGRAVGTNIPKTICRAALEVVKNTIDIDLPPGNEIDELIAEYVFGAVIKDGMASTDPASEETFIYIPPYSMSLSAS